MKTCSNCSQNTILSDWMWCTECENKWREIEKAHIPLSKKKNKRKKKIRR